MKAINRGIFRGKKAILFDMDGTLIDSEPLHAKALFQLVKELSIPITEENLKNLFCGVADHDIYSQLAEMAPMKIGVNEFIQKKNKYLTTIINDYPKEQFEKLISPGAITKISELKNSEFKLGLVSASENDIVKATLSKADLVKYFDTIVSTKDTFTSKPNPSPYLQAMRDLKVKSNQVVIFEDSKSGLMAARKSKGLVVQMTGFTNLPKQVNITFKNFKKL